MPEYIERDTLVSMLDAKSKMAYGTPKMVFSSASRMVELLPAADVAAVVHGKWCWEGKFKACSECGSYVEWNETLGANFWKFCPYCGAKMDKEDDEDK